MKIIQEHPYTDTSGVLVGIIRASSKKMYTEFTDGKVYIDVRHRINYLHCVYDDKAIWSSAVFEILSSNPNIIDLTKQAQVYKKGELVLCQAHVSFSPDLIMYEAIKYSSAYAPPDDCLYKMRKYLINQTTLDELFEFQYFRNFLWKYKDSYLKAI